MFCYDQCFIQIHVFDILVYTNVIYQKKSKKEKYEVEMLFLGILISEPFNTVHYFEKLHVHGKLQVFPFRDILPLTGCRVVF